MKKIYFTLFLFLFAFLWNGQALWNCNSCKIQYGPSESLTKYLDNVKKLANNFNWEMSKATPTTWVWAEGAKIKRSIQRGLNQIISWDGYYSLFDFYVLYGTKSDYVPEIWRDYNLLKKESEALSRYLDRAVKRWYDNAQIDTEKLCSGIENCNFSSTNAFAILWEIIKNHEAVMDYYRLSIIGKRNVFTKNILFVPENFKDEMYEYYNEFTTKNCSSCEWWAFERISKQIDIISNWQQSAKDGMKSWQEAIAMLDGTMDIRQYEARERELLEQELKNQGLSMNASHAVLRNLEKFNENGWYTLNNNFITNSFDYIKNSVKSQIVSFRDSILENFKHSWKKEIPIVEFSKVEENLHLTATIEERIAQMYHMELPYTTLQDNTMESLEGRMIELHYNMTQAIWNLDSTVKVSQKVCNDQWRWLWVCE